MQRLRTVVVSSARAFSSASHAPPKKLHGTAGRYAGALYTAASKAGNLEKVETEVKGFMETFKKNANFSSFMLNPTVARSDKTTMLDGLLDDKALSVTTKNLLLTLSANGRINEVEKVVNSYVELMEASRGETKVIITSAEPLTKKALGTVQTAVMGLVGKNTKVSIEVKENPAIMGGLQVLIGDKFLDLSVVSRMQELTAELEGAEL
jgi:F-type H+-transporting ATPase subunit O